MCIYIYICFRQRQRYYQIQQCQLNIYVSVEDNNFIEYNNATILNILVRRTQFY